MREKSIYSKEQKRLTKKLKEARDASELTQLQAAKKLQRTQSYISKIESGQLKIDLVELKRFARIYNKDINFFVSD